MFASVKMTSLIERLRSHDAPTVWNVSDEAANLIEEQQARIAELEQWKATAEGLLREGRYPELCNELTVAQQQNAKLITDMDRLYKMLLSEPDTKGALFKAENMLREALTERGEK